MGSGSGNGAVGGDQGIASLLCPFRKPEFIWFATEPHGLVLIRRAETTIHTERRSSGLQCAD